MISKIKQTIGNHAKNIIGWKTNRKIVVFSVDDYGNVRLHSKEARDKIFAAGTRAMSRFDLVDTLETTDDLNALYETLHAVKDKNGKPAVFTAYAISANIDFERMAAENYQQYRYELLPETFAKLPGYESTWALWKQGIGERLIWPEFHGREHLNVKVFMEGIQNQNQDVQNSLANRSYTAISDTGYSTIQFPAALDFYLYEENETLKEIVRDGLNAFEKVFGFRATNFTPCGSNGYSTLLDPVLAEGGIRFITTDRTKAEHLGEGRFDKKKFYYTGKKNALGQYYVVRNCVFEPTEDRGIDWVNYCLKQIEAAFRLNMPANISSHRANFCGLVEPGNRERGLAALKALLQAIVTRWPDVEFMHAGEMGDLMLKDKK